MTLKLLVVSVFRRRILQRFFLRVPRPEALPPKALSRTRLRIFGFPLTKSQVVVDRITNESAYGQLYDRPWAQHIRLIRLLPSKNFHAEVRCEIFRASLNRHPDYEALSYAWGDPQITSTVYLEGVRSHVTTNLEQALRHFRHEDRERILWVDALCINQRDVRERNSQVRKMRSIYMSARRVAVWLGPEEDAQVALDFCSELEKIRRMEVSEVFGNASLDKDSESYDPWAIWTRYEEDSPKWKACEALFSGRRWWSRTWIVQEVLHGGRVDFYMGKIVTSLGKLQGRYRIYMTMKARADRADISYSVDTQLDRAIAQSIKKEEEDEIAKRTLHLGITKDEPRSGESIKNSIFVEMLDGTSFSAATTSKQKDHKIPSFQAIDALADYREALQRREVAILFDSTFRYFKGLQSAVSLSLIAEARETIGPGRGIFSWDGPSKSYSLLQLLRMFRAQNASDPRDKVYAFIGMASHSCGIPIDYKCSKRTVYIRTARMLYMNSGLLSVLLAIESSERPVASTARLPSWVPDWTTKQMLVPRFIEELAPKFSANRGLTATDVQHSLPSLPPSILVLKGVYVGIITGTHAMPLLLDGDANDKIKLIRYDRYPHKCHQELDAPHQPKQWPASDATEQVNLTNTSWGPWWAEIGDIIVVTAGSTVPLVLRPVSSPTKDSSSSPFHSSPSSSSFQHPQSHTSNLSGRDYHDHPRAHLLVGSCMLIDSQLRTIGSTRKLSDEPGFSRVMFGSAWDVVFRDDVLDEEGLEEFWLV